MSSSCGLSDLEGWKENKIGAGIAIAFTVTTCLFYIYNGVLVPFLYFKLGKNYFKSRGRDELQRKRLDISVLSGIMASALGLMFIYVAISPWPQLLQAAGIITIVFAQLSALLWQDRYPEKVDGDENGKSNLTLFNFSKELIERIPDISAVIIVTLTLHYTEKQYLDATGNVFYPTHDPNREVILSYAFIGVSSLIGLIGAFSDFWRGRLAGVHNFLLPILFVAVQIGSVATAIYFIQPTLAGGCAIFNATKIVGIITLCCGLLCSLSTAFTDFKQNSSRLQDQGEAHGMVDRIPPQQDGVASDDVSSRSNSTAMGGAGRVPQPSHYNH